MKLGSALWMSKLRNNIKTQHRESENMKVAPLLSTISPSTFQVKAFGGSPFLPQRHKLTCAPCQKVSYNLLRRNVVAQFGVPDEAKIQLNVVKEQLWKSLPNAVKDFPWKKSEDLALQRLLSFGMVAFKWSFIAWFILSFLSDFTVTISRNHELMMPFGLFAGCLLSDSIKETSEELFRRREVKGMNLNFLGTACVFVGLKLVSTSFASQIWTFLLHVANGGIMQLLWLWNRIQVESVEAN